MSAYKLKNTCLENHSRFCNRGGGRKRSTFLEESMGDKCSVRILSECNTLLVVYVIQAQSNVNIIAVVARQDMIKAIGVHVRNVWHCELM